MKNLVFVFAFVFSLLLSNSTFAQSRNNNSPPVKGKQVKATVQSQEQIVFSDEEVNIYHNANTQTFKAINKSGQEVNVDFDEGTVSEKPTSISATKTIDFEPITIVCKCVSKDKNGKCTKYSCTYNLAR